MKTAISKSKRKDANVREDEMSINQGILEDNKSKCGWQFETGEETMTQDLKTPVESN